MANGGWYGTDEEWQRIEAPLLELDEVFEAFAARRGHSVQYNFKDNPNRAIEWHENDVRCLIQLWQVNQANLTFNFWICASLDKGRKRYMKDETLINGKPVPDFAANLPELLEESATKLDEWSRNPAVLGFRTMLG